MLGPAFAVAVDPIRVPSEFLYASERRYLAGSGAKRCSEFAAARSCARRALAKLGFQPMALVPNQDRSPVWPPGGVGSISHSDDWAIAVCARAIDCLAVGVDVEPAAPMAIEEASVILTAREISHLRQINEREFGRLAKVCFSAKEAIYKCQYPLTGKRFDFKDIALTIDGSGRSFVLLDTRLDRTIERVLRKAVCRCEIVADQVIAVATIAPVET